MKRNHTWLLLLFCLVCWACTHEKKQAIEESPPLQIQLDSLIEAEHAANRFDGTVVIGNKEKIIFQKAIGTANRVWSIPMRMDHKFDIASVNKSFFAALILKAVEEQRFQLSTPLVQLLEKYPAAKNFDPNITLHHMLSHTAGIPDYDGVGEDLSANGFFKFKRKRVTNEKYVSLIAGLPPRFEVGTDFYYSNFAYHLLGIILEEVYQKPFAEILKEKITEPLGLKNTFALQVNEEILPKLVEGYNFQKDNSWRRNNFIDSSLGRRIFSTTTDLYRWALAMDDPNFLSKKSLQLMKTNHLSGISRDLSYGYGWVVFDGKGDYKMGKLPVKGNYIIHGGSTEGYKSMVVNIEKGEWVITILSNVGSQTNELGLTEKIIKIINRY